MLRYIKKKTLYNNKTRIAIMNTDLFNQLNQLNWTLVQSDKSATSWSDNWTLDGLNSQAIYKAPATIELLSGEPKFVDANHCVLWTKKEFDKDIKISFDYTKLDNENHSVCILYLLAQGEGSEIYPQDITKWEALRQEPAMNLYFQHMNLYHISFSAFDLKDKNIKYIRARQYGAGQLLEGTDILPDYNPKDMFKKDITIHIDAIKKDNYLFFKATSPTASILCHWKLDYTRLLNKGRIGIRQMAGRQGRFSNIEVFEF